MSEEKIFIARIIRPVVEELYVGINNHALDPESCLHAYEFTNEQDAQEAATRLKNTFGRNRWAVQVLEIDPRDKPNLAYGKFPFKHSD